MWGFQRTLVISSCHVSISPVLNWYRLQQRNPGCIRGEDHVFHVSSFALAMLYKSKIPDYMHWKKNSVLRILPIWQTILASKHLMILYLALFLVAVAEHITGVVSDHITHLQHWALCRLWPCTIVYSHGASRSHKVSDFWFVHSQLERLEVLCEEHKVLQCFCCTEAFGVQKRKQYVCKDGTIRLARQTRSTQIHYSNAFYKALFLLETNQHWGTIYISSGLAISTTEDGKGSLGLRSPFSSNSLLLAALFNCGCLSLSTTTANCHLTHIVIDVMTVIVHLGFLQVRPGIEGGVQLWLHITPAGLSVPPDSCLIWASRQASVNICKHTYGMSWDKKALYCPFVQVELPSRHRNYSSKRWGIRKVIHASHCQPENFPRTSVNLSIIPWYDSYTLALGAQWFFEGTLDDCQHLHEKK